jgi:hypothetical protein
MRRENKRKRFEKRAAIHHADDGGATYVPQQGDYLEIFLPISSGVVV